MASKGQKFRNYDAGLKLTVVKERLEKGTPILELAYRYKVASQESILQWIKSYQLLGEKAFEDKRGVATADKAPLKGRPRKHFDTPEEKKAYLAQVSERNKKKAAEKRRLTKVRKRREARRAYEEAQVIALAESEK